VTDYYVTVCAECMRASCWHGEALCALSRGADTEDVRASDLLTLGLEHRDRFSRAKIAEVCGQVRECDGVAS
jgi:hypothetical protein